MCLISSYEDERSETDLFSFRKAPDLLTRTRGRAIINSNRRGNCVWLVFIERMWPLKTSKTPMLDLSEGLLKRKDVRLR